MKLETDQIFRELEPPPGGAARLRAKLNEGDRRRIASWWLGPAAVAAIAIIALVVFRQAPVTDQGLEADSLMMAADFDRLLGRDSEPYEFTVRRGAEQIEVSQLETTNPRIRLYSFDSPPPEAGTSDDQRL